MSESGQISESEFNPQKFEHVLSHVVTSIRKFGLFPTETNLASIFSSEIVTDSSFEFQELFETEPNIKSLV